MSPKEEIIHIFGEMNIHSYFENDTTIKFAIVVPIIAADWIDELKKKKFVNSVEIYKNFFFIEKKGNNKELN